MKKLLAIIILLFGLFAISIFAQAYQEKCSDGTPYWECSKTKPGYACLYDEKSPNGVSLQNDLINKIVKDPKTKQPKCACENFPGYAEMNGECVKTSCEYNSKTYNNGECISQEKPKICRMGKIEEDPSICGCPIGKEISSDKKTCQARVGCRWGSVNCQPGYKCKYQENDPNDDGKCTPVSGCADFIPEQTKIKCTSLEYCDTTTDPNGKCVPKPGCINLNPPCKSDERCNPITNTCEKLSTLSGLFDGKTQTNASSASNAPAPSSKPGIGSIKCCCLPTFLALGLLGLSILFKNKED